MKLRHQFGVIIINVLIGMVFVRYKAIYLDLFSRSVLLNLIQNLHYLLEKTNDFGRPAEVDMKTRLKVVEIDISHHVTIVTLGS